MMPQMTPQSLSPSSLAAPRRPTLKTWVLAARPKTLTAAAAPVVVATGLAFGEGVGRWLPALAALLGAMLIQIGTNFTNDYYDFKKGADTHERLGPTRVTQSGLIAPATVLAAALGCFALAILSGIYLVTIGGWTVVAIGLASVLCGYAYTGGPFPLAYNGLGDVFVFIFFGLVGVAGSAYVQTRDLTWLAIIASLPIACLATAIIVANNLRDIETDRAAGKHTLATRLGRLGTIREFQGLIAIAYLIPLLLAIIGDVPWAWLVIPVTLPLALPLVTAVQTSAGKGLIPVLVGTSRLTFYFAAVFAMGIIL